MKSMKRMASWPGFKLLDGFERLKARALSVLFIGGVIMTAGGAMFRWFGIAGAIFVIFGLMVAVVGAAAWAKDRQGDEHPEKRAALPNVVAASGLGQGNKREQLPGWRTNHYSATKDEMGLSGLFLEVLSDSGDKQQIFRCEVTNNGAPAGHWDTTEKFIGPKLEDLPPVNMESLLYPSNDFAAAPPMPLHDGEYQVEWFAIRDQLGRQLVALDRFDVVNGVLVDRQEIEEKNYSYSIGQWKGDPNYQCDDCAHSVLKRNEMEEHRAASHRGASAQPAAPAGPDKSFTWANMSGEDDSRPLLHSLSLRLVHIGDRWGRGLVCVVESPTGSRYASPKLVPANQGEFQLNYPQDFDAEPVEDGTYTITWRSFVTDDEAVIATRPIVIRQVVLSSFWKGFKPGLRLVLEESEAREVVQSGSGKYLSDIA